MNRFWESIVEPMLAVHEPRVIIEIGAETGKNTANLLSYCIDHDAVLHAIDPQPRFDVAAWQSEYGSRFVFHRERSLDALPTVGPSDSVLIDGDHNWYTVYNELRLIDEVACSVGRAFPLVFVHDVNWPYGRRDLYYNPDDIPIEYRQPFLRQGIRPGESDLIETGGLNSHLFNATREGGPRNGVLTAIEDFLAERPGTIDFMQIPGLQGLGILSPRSISDDNRLASFFKRLSTVAESGAFVEAIELDRNELQVRSADLAQVAEAERSEALERAQLLFAAQQASQESSLREREIEKQMRANDRARRDAERQWRTTLLTLQSATTQARLAVDEAKEQREFLQRELSAEREFLQSELAREREHLQAELASERERVKAEEVSRNETRERERLRAEADRRDAELRSAEIHFQQLSALLEAKEKSEEDRNDRARQLADHTRQTLEELHGGRDLLQAVLVSERTLLRNELTGERERLQEEIGRERELLQLALSEMRERISVENTLQQRENELMQGEVELRAKERELENEEQRKRLGEAVEAALLRERGYAESLVGAVQRLAQVDRLLAKLADQLPNRKSGRLLESAQQELLGVRKELSDGLRCFVEDRPEPSMRDPPPGEPPNVSLATHVSVAAERDGISAAAAGSTVAVSDQMHQNLVTIVVPVHNAYEEVKLCLEALVRHTRHPHQVLIIDDASTDKRIWPLISEYARSHSHVFAIQNDRNLGYTATINRGCRMCSGDVVLLNSDTQVTDAWLEKMTACAISQPNVATVTAISNAAGAFSVPENHIDNKLPDHLTVDDFAERVEQLSEKIRPRVPTGNGFCMLVTRRVLQAIGSFDEKNFPIGYGEENDFCMRAAGKGFINIVDDSTFVFHKRCASFGRRKLKLAEESGKTLRRLHPTYNQLVAKWQMDDPLDELRRVLASATKEAIDLNTGEKPPCLLYLLHDGGGGAVLTSEDLVRNMSAHFRSVVLKTAIDHWTLFEWAKGELIPIRRYNFRESWKVQNQIDDERRRVVCEVISEFGVSLAHIRHLLGSGPEIIGILKSLGIPVVFSFHDFYTVCPTIHLIDDQGNFCGGKCTEGLGTCISTTRWFRGDVPPIKHHFVYEHRGRMSASLSLCDRYITTSRAAQKVLEDAFPFLDGPKFRIIEHGRDLRRVTAAAPPPQDGPIRVVCFGALGREKGIGLLQEVMKINAESGGRFEFHILGAISRSFDPRKFGATIHGRYERESLLDRLVEIGPSFAMIPSITSETYCHTLTEAWAAGLPVFASDIGTLRERVREHGGGWLLNHRDPQEWYRAMVEILENREEYQDRVDSIRRLSIKSVESMASDYLEVYRDLLPENYSTGSRSLDPPDCPADVKDVSQLVTGASTARDLQLPQPADNVAHVTPRTVTFNDLVRMIQQDENFSLSRWGDGEWHAVLGRTLGETRGGQLFLPGLGEELRRLLRDRPPYLMELVSWERTFGSQVHEWLFSEKLEDLNWIDPNILHRASMSGWLGPAIISLRERPAWVAVGPPHLKAAQKVLGFDKLITVPPNCFPQREKILKKVLSAAAKLPANAVITFSAGMTANLLVDEVFKRLGDRLALIDIGSLWDPYAGVFSRTYMEKEEYQRRLQAEVVKQREYAASRGGG